MIKFVKGDKGMKISILTPTYNRAKLLDKLYASIRKNCENCTNIQIEWLIMDDGSTDNTKDVVMKYISEKNIDVKYFFQKNQGKMKAINNLINKSTGDFILECDSDDYLTENACNVIEKSIKRYKDIEGIYALVFLKYTTAGQNMGNQFIKDGYKSKMFDLYFKEKIIGEKALLYNAKIRKKFQYELENDEKFITEARMQHKMDLKYDVICINKPIMICEYKSDGYTKNISKVFMQNPYGYFKYFKEIFQQNMNGVTLKKRIYVYKHYILFATLTNAEHPIKQVKGILNKIMITILFIPGRIITKIKIKKM